MNQQPPYEVGTPPTGFPPQGYYQPVVPAETSGLATVSLVAGIASVTPLGFLVFPPIVGAVTGALALVRIRGSAGHLKGTTMALWGTVLSGFSLLVLLVVGGFLAVAADQGATVPETVAEQAPDAVEGEPVEPAPEPAEPEPAPEAQGETVAMGEAGTTGDWEVTVTGIETQASYTDEFDFTEYPQGEFQVVQMEVSNQGTEATMFDAEEAVTLIDADGNSHAASFLVGDFFYTDINPGNSATGDVVVDVPAGTEISAVEIVDPWDFADPLTVTVN
ncbi:uncharacterized protein DUF4190 [Nocardiopsis sp. Huas11]|uniref:DUF4190 domain-containing protein n=1 Tax=Nocardiopsis sp. Huas11 TaxID=2183912 RepID=UPI000F15E86F|nr:DUF4190 domain-containing protein [Nocardiopsis sp. Huas11]RKS09070.1 uncharacterized protein DUF4190 [Nocardiopsis sp. Huas11]